MSEIADEAGHHPLFAGEMIWFAWAERQDIDEPEPYCPPYLEYLRRHHPKYRNGSEGDP